MTTIKLKKNSTSGEAPSASDLAVGEVAVNTADGLLYTKHTDNSIKTIGGGTDYSLPLATNTTLGGIELFSDTDQTVAANTVTTAASRTYGIQLNSDNQAVVNVPWVDTNTVYTHPNHSGEVTSTADGATVVADNVVDEANLKVSNTPTDGYMLTAQSGNTGGLTWAEVSSGGGGADLYAANESSPSAQPSATGANAVAIGDGAQATGSDSFALGNSSRSGATRSTAFAFSNAGGINSFAACIGSTSNAKGALSTNSVAMGKNATAGGLRSAALGDEAVTGSNGESAVSLGTSYANGVDSFAAAIGNNTTSYGATGANSVAIGASAKATGSRDISAGRYSQATGGSSVAIGASAIASGADSLALGRSVDATGSNSGAVGYAADATNSRSFALGHSSISNIVGKYAYAGGFIAATGDSQTGTFVLRKGTTDATPTALSTDSGSSTTAGADDQIILPNNSAYAFSGTIVARQQASTGTACAAWKVEGLIRREGSAGTTVLVNSATTVLDNTPAWGMALSADTTNGGLKIQVTGAASTNIRWVATINTSEVTY